MTNTNSIETENNNIDNNIASNNIASNNILPLTNPLTFQGKEIKELTFRDLIARDLKGIKLAKLEDGSIEDILKITSSVVDIPFGVLEMLALKDTMSVIVKVNSLLEK